MLSEVMPEELVPSNLNVFSSIRRASKVYGGYDWSNSTKLRSFATSNDLNAYSRSSKTTNSITTHP